MKQHQQFVDEAVSRRKDFDGCLNVFLDPLGELEAKCEGLDLSGESQPLKVQEKVETVRVSMYTLSLLNKYPVVYVCTWSNVLLYKLCNI